jgi:electron transport complex protein RnfG
MIKPTVSLLMICFVVTFCLAMVNGMTKDVIEEKMSAEAATQRKQVMSEAENFEEVTDWKGKDDSGVIKEVYAAYRGQQLIGYVFGAKPKGYGGEIAITVGITSDLKVSGVIFGDNKETPGLGSKAGDKSFLSQYEGKAPGKAFEIVKRLPNAENEIQAVSGATITSKAVNEAVSRSVEKAAELLSKGGDNK